MLGFFLGGGGLILQWLGVTRLSDPHDTCGRRLRYCFNITMGIPTGIVSLTSFGQSGTGSLVIVL